MSGFNYIPGTSTVAGAVTTSDTGTVTSTMIADATILNADVSQSAGIEGGKVKERDWYFNGSVFLRETIPRWAVNSSANSAPSSGVMNSCAIVLYKGDVVTNVGFVSGATALSAASHWWFALYDTAGNLTFQTADQTNTAWGANTATTLALTSTYTATTTGLHHIGVMVAATTVPNGMTSNIQANAFAQGTTIGSQVAMCRNVGSALTTTAPSSLSGASGGGQPTYGFVS